MLNMEIIFWKLVLVHGILTQALLNSKAKVTAIEIDPELCAKLQKKI